MTTTRTRERVTISLPTRTARDVLAYLDDTDSAEGTLQPIRDALALALLDDASTGRAHGVYLTNAEHSVDMTGNPPYEARCHECGWTIKGGDFDAVVKLSQEHERA